MNILVTMRRKDDGLSQSAIIAKVLEENIRGVARIEWQPQHIIFHFEDGNFFAVKADRVLDMTTYED